LQVVDDFLESIDWTQTIGEDGETFFEDVAIDSPRSSAALRSVGNEINRKKQELEEQLSNSSAQNAAGDAPASDAKQEEVVKSVAASEDVAEAPEEPAASEGPEKDAKEANASEESVVELSPPHVSVTSAVNKGLPPAVIVNNPEDLDSGDASDSAPEMLAAERDEQSTSETEDTTEADKDPSLVTPTEYLEPQEASDLDESNVENETTITITEKTDELSDQVVVPESADDDATEEQVEAAPQEDIHDTTDHTDALTEVTEEVTQEEGEEVPPAVLPDAVSVSPPNEVEEPPVVIVEEEANQ